MAAKEMTAVIGIGGTINPSLQKSLAVAQTKLNGLDKRLAGLAKISMAGLAAGIAAVGAASAAAMAVFSKSVGQAIEFEKQMANVATLLDGDVQGRIKEMSKELIAVSNSTGQATADLTEGLYQVVSAYGDSKDAAKQLEVSAKLAKAGNATTIESINLLSAVTKGYGDTSASAMGRVADFAQLTVKLGQTTFPDLAASMGKVVPMAKAMNITQEELFASYATLTGVTGNAAEVSTQMAAAMKSFAKPSKAMAYTIEKLGYKSGMAMVETEGLHGAMSILFRKLKGDKRVFMSLFESIEATTAALALTGSQSDNFVDKLKSMGKASGSMEKAFISQTDNISDQWGIIKLKISNAMTLIGLSLTPVIKKLIEKFGPVLDRLSSQLIPAMQVQIASVIPLMEKWGDEAVRFVEDINWKAFGDRILKTFGWIKKNGPTILKWAINLGKAFLVFKATTMILNGFATAITLIGGVTKLWTAAQVGLNIAMAANPIGLVITAVGALIAIGWVMYENWDSIVDWFVGAWEWIKDAFSSFCNYLKEEWPMLWEFVKAYVEVFQAFWGGVIDVIVAIWDKACEQIPLLWNGVCQLVSDTWNASVQFIIDLWAKFCQKFPETAKLFKEVGAAIAQALKDAFTSVRDWALKMMTDLRDNIINMFAGIKNFIAKLNPFGGGDSKKVKAYAAGGFTDGVSICGEAGTEAVISFDPRYRAENQGYVMQAADMLGMVSPAQSVGLSSGSRQSVTNYDLGGIKFAPVINVANGGNSNDIMRQLRSCLPDLADEIIDLIDRKKRFQYGD